MKNLFFTLITSIIILFLWRSWDVQVYQSYHSSWKESSVLTTEVDIRFIQDINIVLHPVKEKWIIDAIHAAKREIKVATYMFTLPSIRWALLDAKNRWLEVEVLLEKSPYNAVSINRETREFFEKNNIRFYETQDDWFSFMHAKYMIFDDTWIISTANWTRSSFESNREFSIVGNDKEILQTLRDTFKRDFTSSSDLISTPHTLLIWPNNTTRDTVLRFLETTEKNILLYMPNISDTILIQKFQTLCHNGKKIRILLDQNEENKKNGNVLEKNGCPDVRLMKRPSLHWKALIIDEKSGFLWSFNFTENSLENNREVGIFIDWDKIQSIVNIFQKDWEKSVDF